MCRSIVCRHTCLEGRGVRLSALTRYNRLLRTTLRTFTHRLENQYYGDFYVDDFLKSMEEENDAMEMINELPKLLKRGGFRLCQWLSNRKRVIEAIPESERAKGAPRFKLASLIY